MVIKIERLESDREAIRAILNETPKRGWIEYFNVFARNDPTYNRKNLEVQGNIIQITIDYLDDQATLQKRVDDVKYLIEEANKRYSDEQKNQQTKESKQRQKNEEKQKKLEEQVKNIKL
ncbi:MAG: hypothetical protein KAT28_02410 [Candidatus Aenigmarchaeota archaeon]|nr:hypothetical protein [Candidatus Aenigmarchaeota archaeon]